MKLTRRELLKSLGILGLSFPIPPTTVDPDLSWEFADYDIDGKRMAELMEIEQVRKDRGIIYATLTVAESDLWECVRLVDTEGNRWYTTNAGAEWQCDSKSFVVELVKNKRMATFSQRESDGMEYRRA